MAPSDVRRYAFDALVIAEGEWSTTCNLLGVTKAVDKFATAIGLIVNVEVEPSHPSSLRSFVATGVDPRLAALAERNLAVENLGVSRFLGARAPEQQSVASGPATHAGKTCDRVPTRRNALPRRDRQEEDAGRARRAAGEPSTARSASPLVFHPRHGSRAPRLPRPMRLARAACCCRPTFRARRCSHPRT
jgi:hypothetical protein